MPHGEPARGARIDLLGAPVDAVDMDEAVERCEGAIAARHYLQQVSVNASKFVAMSEDPELSEMVAESDLVTADGQSVVWAARLLGTPLPERVAGIDLMGRLLAAADRRGYRVFVLGARREVLDTALERLQARYPGMVVAGARDGYYRDSEVDEV
jgi:N-acetylglucosaminyldiphosphoundecaprenol N-acetyl-beta-D-mannosaminyltransferase